MCSVGNVNCKFLCLRFGGTVVGIFRGVGVVVERDIEG